MRHNSSSPSLLSLTYPPPPHSSKSLSFFPPLFPCLAWFHPFFPKSHKVPSFHSSAIAHLFPQRFPFSASFFFRHIPIHYTGWCTQTECNEEVCMYDPRANPPGWATVENKLNWTEYKQNNQYSKCSFCEFACMDMCGCVFVDMYYDVNFKHCFKVMFYITYAESLMFMLWFNT